VCVCVFSVFSVCVYASVWGNPLTLTGPCPVLLIFQWVSDERTCGEMKKQ